MLLTIFPAKEARKSPSKLRRKFATNFAENFANFTLEIAGAYVRGGRGCNSRPRNAQIFWVLCHLHFPICFCLSFRAADFPLVCSLWERYSHVPRSRLRRPELHNAENPTDRFLFLSGATEANNLFMGLSCPWIFDDFVYVFLFTRTLPPLPAPPPPKKKHIIMKFDAPFPGRSRKIVYV